MLTFKKRDDYYVTDDIHVSKFVTVKCKVNDTECPQIVEFLFSLNVFPTNTLEKEEYEKMISSITRKYNIMCKHISHACNSFDGNKYIKEFNFTSANLKKGYKKYVTGELYLRNITNKGTESIINDTKHTLSEAIEEFIEQIEKSGFTCKKK